MPTNDPTNPYTPDRATDSAAEPASTAPEPREESGGTAPAPAGPPTIAATFETPSPDRYRLGKLLSGGGMGDVYRATDAILNRDVAVKVVKPRYAGESRVVRRFEEEARITAQLQHPAIPPVHDLGTLPDGRPFLAMKLIRGDTLEALLAARHSPAADRGRFGAAFEKVCEAVAFAHAHRVIHRDLKPANVMVGSFGEVQVMDWGLAKVLGEQPLGSEPGSDEPGGTEIQSLRDAAFGETQAGAVMGTLAYMPREQAIGAVDQVDARSDVFGLGGILAVILTGDPPFVGPITEVVRQMAASGSVAACFARLDASGADPELVALCKRCLSPEKGDRPADGGEVARAVAGLRAAADDRARHAELDRVKAEGDRLAAEVRSAEQRKWARVQLMLFAAVGLLFAAAGAFAWWRQDQRSQRAAAEARLEGQRDAESDAKATQARQGIDTNLKLSADLRRAYKFKAADAALAQAADLARGGAPERLAEVELAQRDLALVIRLDDIRYRKWEYIAEFGGRGRYNTKFAPVEYRRVFRDHGVDVATASLTDAATRLASRAIRAELVAALDDWALYEEDPELATRVLKLALLADPGEWAERIRDPSVRKDPGAIKTLEASARRGGLRADQFVTLAQLSERHQFDPAALLIVARTTHPSDFEIAFLYGLSQRRGVTGRDRHRGEIAAYESARSLRPDNVAVWVNLSAAYLEGREFDAAVAAGRRAVELDPNSSRGWTNIAAALCETDDLDGAAVAARKAIELDTAFTAGPHGTLGMIHVKRGQPKLALPEFREAIRQLLGRVDKVGVVRVSVRR